MHGEAQQRSDLSEAELTQTLQAAGVTRLAGADEVWVALDGSDLRKPHAEQNEIITRTEHASF